MRRATRTPRCFQCNKEFNFEVPSEFTWTCEWCGVVSKNLMCDACKPCKIICENCSLESKQLILKKNFDGVPQENFFKFCNTRWIFTVVAILLALIVFFCYKNGLGKNKNTDESNFIKKLKKMYPSQKPETWYHFQSVLENKDLSVRSITFLHNEDKTTSDCLIRELVSRFSDSKNLKIEEITFSEVGFEEVDYGLVQEHYHAVVKKFRVFRADLTNISGKHARIFHSLCDEVSSDVKPSLFIFTIKCIKQMENLKPLVKATTVLQESWNDLSSSELFPLLSRVIKNVVEIIPEAQSSCIEELV